MFQGTKIQLPGLVFHYLCITCNYSVHFPCHAATLISDTLIYILFIALFNISIIWFSHARNVHTFMSQSLMSWHSLYYISINTVATKGNNHDFLFSIEPFIKYCMYIACIPTHTLLPSYADMFYLHKTVMSIFFLIFTYISQWPAKEQNSGLCIPCQTSFSKFCLLSFLVHFKSIMVCGNIF